ncbi:biotin-dependent carboxyltransferase family protein [Bacillus thermotolerans]|uniref:5-oxoprolinase subunit C family protein n=1 Tax=Bacillus thermotolerans TaxID=1221996 RepID=UPI0005890674|nr:biotin-dependent carboxyltransferase family protein [Bacillus thermotolerans]KKB37500.1 Allophanate hydrolase 2 subunit 2 [Bacillus thermotolerans]
MSIRVNRPGLLASIQDLGRYGFQKYGVIVSGAMDAVSLRLANLLVGNEEGEAALEVTLMGTSLVLEEDALISITGGDLSAVIDGEAVPMWKPVYVKKGSVLQFKGCQSGCRAYVSVSGGFAVPEVMNSKSTYLRGEIGGYEGRALQAGDRLRLNEMPERAIPLFQQLKRIGRSRSYTATNWSINSARFICLKKPSTVRVMRGAEFDRFNQLSQTQFFEQDFQITPKSDRMGYRMSGPGLELKEPFELVSEAVSHGTIQVPQDGNPIILLADRQTTGGYPRIAQVATVDLPIIAQLKPGEKIRFKEITLEEAEQLYLEQEEWIQEVKIGVSLKPGLATLV